MPDAAALNALHRAVHELYDNSNYASINRLAHSLTDRLSRGVVFSVFTPEGTAHWDNLAIVVHHLGGNLDQFRAMWAAATTEHTVLAEPTLADVMAELRIVRAQLTDLYHVLCNTLEVPAIGVTHHSPHRS